MLFRDERDVFQCDISVKGEPVEWESEEGQQLLKLLPPSAKLINFRIAHEVAHLKSYDFLYYTVLSPVVLVCGYHFSVFMSKGWLLCSIYKLCVYVIVIDHSRSLYEKYSAWLYEAQG